MVVVTMRQNDQIQIPDTYAQDIDVICEVRNLSPGIEKDTPPVIFDQR